MLEASIHVNHTIFMLAQLTVAGYLDMLPFDTKGQYQWPIEMHHMPKIAWVTLNGNLVKLASHIPLYTAYIVLMASPRKKDPTSIHDNPCVDSCL